MVLIIREGKISWRRDDLRINAISGVKFGWLSASESSTKDKNTCLDDDDFV
jgi:hypothetical protein